MSILMEEELQLTIAFSEGRTCLSYIVCHVFSRGPAWF
jgi:hypothetical protein